MMAQESTISPFKVMKNIYLKTYELKVSESYLKLVKLPLYLCKQLNGFGNISLPLN